MRNSPWSSSSGKVKEQAKAKERRQHAGTAVKVITAAEIARMTNKTTAGTDGGAWKIQKGSRAGKDAGKGWDASKSSWNRWENSKGKGKDWQGSGKSKNGNARTD